MRRAVASAAMLCAALIASGDTRAETRAPFACTPGSSGALSDAAAGEITRHACSALRAASGDRDAFTVSGDLDDGVFTIVLARVGTDDLARGFANDARDLEALADQLAKELAARATPERRGAWAQRAANERAEQERAAAVEAARRIPAEERQLTFSLVSVATPGLPRRESGGAIGMSIGYRLATPRWSFGGVFELGSSRGPDQKRDGAPRFLSLSYSVRRFLSAEAHAFFVGGGVGYLGISTHWATSESSNRCRDLCLGWFEGEESRGLATVAPFVEGGAVAWRKHAAQLVASVRVDIPFERLDRWEGPEERVIGREVRPAVYVLPVSFRLGVQF